MHALVLWLLPGASAQCLVPEPMYVKSFTLAHMHFMLISPNIFLDAINTSIDITAMQ